MSEGGLCGDQPHESLKCFAYNIKLHMPFKKGFPIHPSGSFMRKEICSMSYSCIDMICFFTCLCACLLQNHKYGHAPVPVVKLSSDKEEKGFLSVVLLFSTIGRFTNGCRLKIYSTCQITRVEIVFECGLCFLCICVSGDEQCRWYTLCSH